MNKGFANAPCRVTLSWHQPFQNEISKVVAHLWITREQMWHAKNIYTLHVTSSWHWTFQKEIVETVKNMWKRMYVEVPCKEYSRFHATLSRHQPFWNKISEVVAFKWIEGLCEVPYTLQDTNDFHVTSSRCWALKHRYRRNVTSYHFFSLLWISKHL